VAKDLFKDNHDIRLMLAYRKSIHLGNPFGLKNFLQLLKFKHGVKLIGLYVVTRGTGSYCLSRFLFTQLRRFI
jgi:hypothetical protein